VPVLDDLVGLKPEDAVLVGRFGDLGLIKDRWRVVGPQPGFRRVDWPMPVFVSHDEIRDLYWKRWYDEDTLEWGREEWMPRGVVLEGPSSGLMGSEFVQRRLNRLLPWDEGSGVVG
jgi:hypothetical protein